MKVKLFALVLLMMNSTAFSQSLEGEWNGYFTSNPYGNKTKIILFFSKINDSTFKGISTTIVISNNQPDTAICVLEGGFLKKNILYLEEKRSLKDFNESDPGPCFQLMKLYYFKRKKKYELHGEWFSEGKDCDGNGSIFLTKSF